VYKNWIEKTPVSKIVTDGNPQNSEQRNEAYFLVGKYLVDECDYMIFVWDELKPRGQGGTSEILGYASKSKSLKGFEIIKIKSDKTDEIDKDINTQLNISDNEAVRLKKNYERVWLASIILGWLTAICFALTLSFHFNLFEQLIFCSLELLFIFIVFGLIRFTKEKEIHPNLLNNRLRAEKLRLLIVYYNTDIPITISDITLKNDKGLADVTAKANDTISKSYQSIWYKYFVIKNLIDGQVAYHRKKIKRDFGSKPENLKRLTRVIYVTFIAILFGHFFTLLINNFHIYIPLLSDYGYPHEIMRFISILLPATYGALQGLLFFKDWEKLKAQSITMIDFLTNKGKELSNAEMNNESFTQILNTVCAAMLADNKNWNLILKEKAAPHPIM
jgi:hypothetical protein